MLLRSTLKLLYTIRTIRGEAAAESGAGKHRWANLRHAHELYNVGHLYEAAVAHFEATGKRTLLDVAVRNADLVRELGADDHVDYAATDPATLRDVDAFFDVFGSMPWPKARPTLSRRGRYCTTIPRPDTFLRGGLARLGLHRAHLVLVRSRREDLQQLTAWLESGRLRPVIDRELPWQDCAEGHRLLETKRTRGKIVLRVRPKVDGEAP